MLMNSQELESEMIVTNETSFWSSWWILTEDIFLTDQ